MSDDLVLMTVSEEALHAAGFARRVRITVLEREQKERDGRFAIALVAGLSSASEAEAAAKFAWMTNLMYPAVKPAPKHDYIEPLEGG